MAATHPVRVVRDVIARAPDEPTTWSLAPAVRRLERDPGARVHALGGRTAEATARRLARLVARPME
jgi:hypothetical protein